MEKVFRAYDIRGVYKRDITEEFARKIGLSFGTVLGNEGTVVVGRDARIGGPELQGALADGLMKAGISVIDIGMVPIPVLNYRCMKPDADAGVIISASHNPPEFNGIRFRQSDGTGFISGIPKMKELYFTSAFKEGQAEGGLRKEETRDVVDDYIDFVLGKVKLERGLRVVLDPGNGAASGVASRLFEEAGCDVTAIFDEPDGMFPGRGPHPTKGTLGELEKTVREQKADVGFAYDGDSDRVVVVDDTGNTMSAEEAGIVMAREILPNSEIKRVALNIDCSMVVEEEVKKLGGEVERIRVGDVFLAEAVKRGAVFAMESSSHFIIPSIFPFDDGISNSLFVAGILSRTQKSISELTMHIPTYPIIRKTVEVPDERKFAVVAKMVQMFRSYRTNDIDGVKVDFDDGWALVRASNTQPLLRLTAEAKTQTLAEEYMGKMESALRQLI